MADGGREGGRDGKRDRETSWLTHRYRDALSDACGRLHKRKCMVVALYRLIPQSGDGWWYQQRREWLQ